TDCSIVTASAPGYVAVTSIWGGTISGNCAMGNVRIDTRPDSTVKIAITIATMGRLMKNFGTGHSPFAVNVNGFGDTTSPSFANWAPSTATRSPGRSPDETTSIGPRRSPTVTARVVIWLSEPNTRDR